MMKRKGHTVGRNLAAGFVAAALTASCGAVAAYAAENQVENGVKTQAEDLAVGEYSEKVEERTLEERMDSTYNLLLIGVDRRDDSWNGNSDVMLLLTVNPEKEKVYMTSFLRDLYADIDGLGVQKLNAACAYGGAKLCVETIEENYKVKIDNYAMVDFNAMIAVVDTFDGVDVELTADEVEVSNNYVRTMCEANEEPYEEHQIVGSGMLHLDGYQAVAFMRNRYSGVGSDFGRTERQREVMGAILSKMQEAGIDKVDELLFDVLPKIEHNVGMIKTLDLVTKLPDWLEYETEQLHIPYDDLYYSQNEILVPDMEETIQRLQDTIY